MRLGDHRGGRLVGRTARRRGRPGPDAAAQGPDRAAASRSARCCGGSSSTARTTWSRARTAASCRGNRGECRLRHKIHSGRRPWLARRGTPALPDSRPRPRSNRAGPVFDPVASTPSRTSGRPRLSQPDRRLGPQAARACSSLRPRPSSSPISSGPDSPGSTSRRSGSTANRIRCRTTRSGHSRPPSIHSRIAAPAPWPRRPAPARCFGRRAGRRRPRFRTVFQDQARGVKFEPALREIAEEGWILVHHPTTLNRWPPRHCDSGIPSVSVSVPSARGMGSP